MKTHNHLHGSTGFEFLDLGDPNHVEVSIRSDGKVLWVNVNGKCALRISRIGNVVIDDLRVKHSIFVTNPDKTK